MLKRFTTSIAILMALAAVGTGPVQAQGTHGFEVEIPFPFVLQDRELPKGKYRLERIDPAKPNLLMIKNNDTHLVRLILTERVEKEFPSTANYLLFRRREEKLYLFQVWTTGAVNGIQIPALDEKGGHPRAERASVVRLNGKTP
jgi:hypothetical protein